MRAQDREFRDLEEEIKEFCVLLRDEARGKDVKTDLTYAAGKIVLSFENHFPKLSAALRFDLPSVVYAAKVVEFGMRGLDRPIYDAIWKEYYVAGETIRTVSYTTSHRAKTVSNHIALFPGKVARQLYEKEEEMRGNPISPLTDMTLLRSAFSFTARQAEVAMAFYPPEKRVGRMRLAEKLGISFWTLKDHIRAIIKKTGTGSMNEAMEEIHVVLTGKEDATHRNKYPNDSKQIGNSRIDSDE